MRAAMWLETWLLRILAVRNDRKYAKLTAKFSDIAEGKNHDISYLDRCGVIRVNGTGYSISRINVSVENKIIKGISIKINVGTIFLSRGSHQNMASVKEYNFSLEPRSSLSFDVDVVCVNADRPIPGEHNRFLGVSMVSEAVVRFIVASRDEDAIVRQVGVWTLTDHYSRTRIMKNISSKDDNGNVIYPITHQHCDRAKAILNTLKIRHSL